MRTSADYARNTPFSFYGYRYGLSTLTAMPGRSGVEVLREIGARRASWI
jgi:hypothetical protein